MKLIAQMDAGEFPAGPLAVGNEPVAEIIEIEFPTGRLRLLSPTDCVKDRLSAYYHWQDRQCLEQAVLVAAENAVNFSEIERWSEQEGMLKEYLNIQNRFSQIKDYGNQ